MEVNLHAVDGTPPTIHTMNDWQTHENTYWITHSATGYESPKFKVIADLIADWNARHPAPEAPTIVHGEIKS